MLIAKNPMTEGSSMRPLLLVLVLILLLPTARAAAESVSPAELARIRYELSKVQLKVNDAGGQPFELSKYDKKAFNLVREIAGRHPDDPGVKRLIAEAKKLYQATKGVRFEITPEMLAYRQRGKDLAGAVAAATAKRWRVLRGEVRTGMDHIEKPFPAPKPEAVDLSELEGSTLILEAVPYDRALFVQSGRNWVPVGKPTTGFYWIAASGRDFDPLYEALRRFRSQVTQALPENWTFVCRVVGPDVMVPGGGKKSGGTARLGWLVEPIAIHIPGTVLVELDEDSEDGARFTAESAIQELIKFSVETVPEDVKPDQLVRIYVVALKEKNFNLHLDCIDPQQRAVGPQVAGLRYNWGVSQKGLERYHVHAEPTQVGEIRVTAGAVDEDLESFFGDEKKPAPEPNYKEERVRVTVRLFNVHGVQTVRPRYVTLIRRNAGRWYIYSGATLTF